MRHILLALTFFIFLTSFAHAQAEKPTIAVLLKSTTHPYWQIAIDGIEDMRDQVDAEILISNTTRPNDSVTQLDLCETLFTRKPDALIVAAINPYNLVSCIEKFNAADIPVIDMDGNYTAEILQEVDLNSRFLSRPIIMKSV